MLFFSYSFVTLAHASSPKLNSISPAGGQRGTEMEIRFLGQRLGDAQEIIFYTPGIELVKFEPPRTNTPPRARIRIAKDCRLGEHPLRVRTESGVSELRTFWVGPFKTVEESEPNNETAKAQKIPLNVTVAGKIESEDVDYFQIEAKRGQRLSAEIEAMRLGRAAFDPYLAILDGNGAVVKAADDTSLLMQDAFLSFVAPKDGTYFVQVRETSYGGSGEFVYRLHVGSFPRPTAVFPPGGQTGETLSVKFLGDPIGDIVQELKLPATSQDKFGVVAEQAGVSAPSPNWMRVSDFPNVIASGVNQDRSHATATDLLPPVALNGILAKKGDSGWFRFRAKKGQALDVNVFARRLRSPLDSVLEIFDEKGNSLAANDDAAGADSYVKFTPAADADFFLRVKDQLGAGGLDYTYRVEITPAEPLLTVSIPQVARYDSQTRQYIVVPKGNRFATLISAKRANFSGDLNLGIDGLPDGVSLHADTMPGRVDSFPLVFEASGEARIGGKLCNLTATLAESGKSLPTKFRHEVELVQGPNNTVYYGTPIDRLYVGVTREAPFRLRLEEPKVPIVQAGTMDLKIIADRRPGFDEPINVKMLWNPPGITSVPDATIAKGRNSVEYHLNASGDAPTRTWQICVLGTANVGGGQISVSTPLIPIEVATPFLGGKIETVNASPGDKAKLVCKLEQKQPFEGKATIKLVGLPDKVTTSDQQITKDDKEVVFELNIDPACKNGSTRTLACTVAIKRGVDTITQTVANNGVLRIVPPKKGAGGTKVAAKTEGKTRP